MSFKRLCDYNTADKNNQEPTLKKKKKEKGKTKQNKNEPGDSKIINIRMHYLLEGQTSFYEKVWTKLCLETDSQIQSHEHAYLNFNNKGINSQNILAAGNRALSPSF